MPLSFFTNSGNSYGSAIPFQRIVEPAQLGLFLNLEQAELLRIQRYNEHWRFYFGKQWIFDREDGEPLVTLNFSKLIVDKSVSWLVKNGFDIEVPKALKHVVGPFLEEVWRYNKRQQFLYMLGQTGAVTGDCFVMVSYQRPSESAIRANPNSQGAIKINLLGSEQVYPSWDPLDVDVLTAVRIETLYYDDRNQLNRVDRDDKANHQGRQLYVKRFTQILTPDHIIEQYEGGDPIVRDNVLGEIPVVHIRNLPLSREFYGLSDMDGIIDLQREMNEKSTDISDIINYHAAPVTIMQGAKASQLERGARQIWSGIPQDAKIFNLELQGNLTASQDYLQFIKTSTLEIAEVPKILLETPAISNTSGVALHLQYQPIVDKTKRKVPFYQKGLEDINYFILRIAALLGLLHLPYDLCSTCGGRIVEVLDTKGPFPRTVKKCFHIDPNDFSFLTPDQVRIKYIRQHSFGQELREAEFGQIKQEHKQKSASYWDPQPEEAQQEYEDKRRAEKDAVLESRQQLKAEEKRGEETGGSAATRPKVKTPSIEAQPPKMMGDIVLPPEPEEVMLSTVWIHPTTGERVNVDRQRMMLVPMDCPNPQYLDPFSTRVVMRDALPRDHSLDFNLFREMLKEGLVSKAWVRRRLPIIDEKEYEQIEREIQEEKVDTARPGGSETEDKAEAAPRESELDRAMNGASGHNSKEPKKDKEV